MVYTQGVIAAWTRGAFVEILLHNIKSYAMNFKFNKSDFRILKQKVFPGTHKMNFNAALRL